MGYIKASDIRIFPSSSRTVSNQQGTNWLTEHNLANISEQFFTNKDGFVIEPLGEDPIAPTSEVEVKFNIAGYYFETHAADINTALTQSEETSDTTSLVQFTKDSGNSNIIATIKIAKSSSGTEDSYYYLQGRDSNQSNNISAVDEKSSKSFSLVLFQEDNGNWKVPRASRINLPNTRLDNSTLSNGATIILGEGSNSTITGGANGGTLSNVVINGNNTSIDIGGTITANGSISTKTNLTVESTTSLHNNLTVATGGGAAVPNITLNANVVNISGNNGSSLTLNANSTLNVTGLVNINGSNEDSSLALGASGNFLNVNKNGLTTGVNATFNNTVTINSTLNVTGLTTLSGKTTFNSDATLTDHLLINGSLSGTDISNAIISSDVTHTDDNKNLARAFKIDDGELK